MDIDYFNIGDWMSKVMVALAGGERCDLMPYLFQQSVTTMTAQNMAMPLDDLVNQYAPDALEVMAPYVDAYRFNGVLYGFPTLKNWVSNGYIIMRKDILEELDLVEKAQNLDSWSGYEEIMQAVTEKYGGTGLYAGGHGANYSIMTSIAGGSVSGGDLFSEQISTDSLGDPVGVIFNDHGKLSLFQEQEAVVNELKMVRSWMDKGYLWPDSPLTEDHGDELMKQGVQFSTIQNSEIGVEVTKGASIGKELICTKYSTGVIRTSSVQTWGCGIPVTAEEPEAAAYLLNALYTDKTLMNLLTWGVEGEDYDLVDGQVKTRDGQYYEADFLMGNNLLLTPIYGNGVDHYEKVAADIASAEVSPYLGFALDRAPLNDLISNITTVNDQYQKTLYGGLYSDEVYNEYIDKLKAAGVEEYLAAIQAQLDAWMAQ